MVYKKLFFTIILFILSILFSSCSSIKSFDSASHPEKESDSTSHSINNDNSILEYTEYQELFQDLYSNIKVEGFEVTASTISDNITLVESDLSFGKRNALTVGGSRDLENALPTEERIILENEDKSTQIAIGIYYIDSFIGNDLIAWDVNQRMGEANEELTQTVFLSIFTYKNIVFSINQIDTEKINTSLSKETIRSAMRILENY